MSKRKPIGTKLRFEVFKRDSFTCQYCGKKAPDVILHVDHINPVSRGGENDVLNLITACSDCNHGKGATPLTDRSEIEKQQVQLAELNERRQQLEWMLEWRQQLSGLEDHTLSSLASEFERLVPGSSVNDSGIHFLKKWHKKFGAELLLKAISASVDSYLECDAKGEPDKESVHRAWSMIPRVAASIQLEAEKPYMRDVYYIRATIRNRFSYIDEKEALRLIERAILLDADVESLKRHARSAGNWSRYKEGLETYIAEREGQK